VLPLFSIRKAIGSYGESVDDKTGKYGESKLLFNLKDDFNETIDLAAKDPQKVKELEQLLHQWAR
jgi:hypothetical protein